MRTCTGASSSPSSSGRLKSDLAKLEHQIHKTSTIHNIANDSGVSFCAETPSQQSARKATGGSIASIATITPESAPDRASTLRDDATSAAKMAPGRNLALTLPLLPQLDAGLSSGASNVMASPSIIKSDDPFFAQEPAPRSSLSISSTSSQDFELNDLWDSLARQLKPIADVLRTGRHRTSLGSSRLPADCVSVLQLWLCAESESTTSNQPVNNHALEAAIEIFRVFANLCIDHDSNRSILDGAGAAPTVLAAVSLVLRQQDRSRSSAILSLKILTFLRAAMGAVLNMQLEHISTRQSLATVNCITTLASVAAHPRIYLPHLWAVPRTVEIENDADVPEKLQMGATVSSWAWRVVQEIFDDIKEEKEGQPGTPSDETHNANLDDVNDEASSHDVRSILSRHCINDLLRPLSLYALHTPIESESQVQPEMDTDDVEALVDSDAEILQTAATLIESCAAEEPEMRCRAVQRFKTSADGSTHAQLETQFQSGLDVLMSFVEKAQLPREWVKDSSALQASPASCNDDCSALSTKDAQVAEEMRKAFAQVKACAARAVVAISGDDSNMVELFSGSSGFIGRLQGWIRYDPKTRDDLVSCGMLALGNLARSDAHCLSLVQEHNLAPFLASLLAKADDIKVAHGLVSLLKNLSIPAANKAVIGRLDVIDAVVGFMGRDKDMVQPLQFATVGLLKHLCAGVTENAIRFVGGEASSGSGRGPLALNALIDMVERIDDVPTKMEATRVLVNVVKSLWTSTPHRNGGKSNDMSEQVILAARRKVVRRDVLQALAEMVRTSPKYPVLVNEGIIALTLVGSETTGAELVSLSLLAQPTKPMTDEDTDNDMDSDGEMDAAASASRNPRRRSTVDSSASTSSHPLPPPDCALDMVNLVLARRDARMPPQFASNACALVLSLCHATQSANRTTTTGTVGQNAIARVAANTRPALETLKHHGPTEALAAAADALHAVTKIATV
ncbi:uncharacterized protein UMAG_11926 [Mycosarcoma maydis]|uniref:Uncharacterized protein n=1 Tax=Mycosarcoma maydis TaxID=5270 RepID=A0A0D1C710_MYCMD|nr:uncharacterized protein UMAG_11926 [Ustilago maydis 521]KIS69362.1 hypothetical protein UMAG_11926 [Ustilago maydis 521]|eukprot:XP_011389246.1 hypothetical protein UMAG_11926 [Ustilago maydis 521]